MLEGRYKTQLVAELKRRYPGCVVTKNDAAYIQGIPDLVIFFGQHYALLEVKKSEKEATQPNQKYYVDLFDRWQFAAFIYPENQEEVLRQLDRVFYDEPPQIKTSNVFDQD